jgi:hypothetical protein
VVPHLLQVPTSPDSEDEAPSGEAIDRSDRLRGRDRVTLHQQADGGPHPDPLRGPRRGREGDERVMDAGVLIGQLPAGRVWRLTRGGNVGVVGDEEGLEATLLGHGRQFRRLDGLIGGEVGDAEIHAAILSSAGPGPIPPGDRTPGCGPGHGADAAPSRIPHGAAMRNPRRDRPAWS